MTGDAVIVDMVDDHLDAAYGRFKWFSHNAAREYSRPDVAVVLETLLSHIMAARFQLEALKQTPGDA